MIINSASKSYVPLMLSSRFLLMLLLFILQHVFFFHVFFFLALFWTCFDLARSLKSFSPALSLVLVMRWMCVTGYEILLPTRAKTKETSFSLKFIVWIFVLVFIVCLRAVHVLGFCINAGLMWESVSANAHAILEHTDMHIFISNWRRGKCIEKWTDHSTYTADFLFFMPKVVVICLMTQWLNYKLT